MMKRFLTPHQWRVVLFITAVSTAFHVLFFFVRRAIGWDTMVFHPTDNQALNFVFDVALFALSFGLLVAVFTHYGIVAKDEKGQK